MTDTFKYYDCDAGRHYWYSAPRGKIWVYICVDCGIEEQKK